MFNILKPYMKRNNTYVTQGAGNVIVLEKRDKSTRREVPVKKFRKGKKINNKLKAMKRNSEFGNVTIFKGSI